MRPLLTILVGCALVPLSLGALAWPAVAQNAVSVSPDVTVPLSGTVAADEDVALDDLLGGVALASLGGLPANAAVTAYHRLPGGDQLFAVDTALQLPGPLVVERRDVVRYDGASYTLQFDGSARGVPNGAAVDGVSVTALGQLLLSFDTTVQVGGVVAADEDVVGWDASGFALALDGSALGIPRELDVDGIHDLQDTRGALSFDGSGVLGGVAFADEDVLIFDFVQGTWTLAYDGSVQHAALAAADVEAVALPEPSSAVGLGCGILLLFGLGPGRMRSDGLLQKGSRT
jgi:hypothetical protein